MGALQPSTMRNQSTPNARANAQVLRRETTDSERKLWGGLRSEQLGVKFRRQHPLGNYIADFACLAPKLIVELDGSQHQAQQVYDARRDAFFREKASMYCASHRTNRSSISMGCAKPSPTDLSS